MASARKSARSSTRSLVKRITFVDGKSPVCPIPTARQRVKAVGHWARASWGNPLAYMRSMPGAGASRTRSKRLANGAAGAST